MLKFFYSFFHGFIFRYFNYSSFLLFVRLKNIFTFFVIVFHCIFDFSIAQLVIIGYQKFTFYIVLTLQKFLRTLCLFIYIFICCIFPVLFCEYHTPLTDYHRGRQNHCNNYIFFLHIFFSYYSHSSGFTNLIGVPKH